MALLPVLTLEELIKQVCEAAQAAQTVEEANEIWSAGMANVIHTFVSTGQVMAAGGFVV